MVLFLKLTLQHTIHILSWDLAKLWSITFSLKKARQRWDKPAFAKRLATLSLVIIHQQFRTGNVASYSVALFYHMSTLNHVPERAI